MKPGGNPFPSRFRSRVIQLVKSFVTNTQALAVKACGYLTRLLQNSSTLVRKGRAIHPLHSGLDADLVVAIAAPFAILASHPHDPVRDLSADSRSSRVNAVF